MTQLICGFGDVGKGLYEILSKHYPIEKIDKDAHLKGQFDVIHICFPYSESFYRSVHNYIAEYAPELVIIHSTVPPGTTEKIVFPRVVHSPVRGRHPSMARDMKTYTKYFGGRDAEYASSIFEEAGIRTKCFTDPKATELGKLLCNIRWGLNISFAQEQKRMCDYYGVRYEDVVNDFEKTRNEGLTKIGRENAQMPILFPGLIGGHCVMPNVDILMEEYPSLFFKAIKESNDKYGQEL
jgi:UDP-N-acetyl-D-mannosaminuronate dehydrogenase